MTRKENPKRPPTTKRSETLLVGVWEGGLFHIKQMSRRTSLIGPVDLDSALTAKGLGSAPGLGELRPHKPRSVVRDDDGQVKTVTNSLQWLHYDGIYAINGHGEAGPAGRAAQALATAYREGERTPSSLRCALTQASLAVQ